MKDLLVREDSYLEEEYLVQQIEILKVSYMKQIQPYVDKLVHIRSNRMPELIFILNDFSPSLFEKEK